MAHVVEHAHVSEYIDNAELSGCGGHPRMIIFLTADAFGVLPPIARLTPTQARRDELRATRGFMPFFDRGPGYRQLSGRPYAELDLL